MRILLDVGLVPSPALGGLRIRLAECISAAVTDIGRSHVHHPSMGKMYGLSELGEGFAATSAISGQGNHNASEQTLGGMHEPDGSIKRYWMVHIAMNLEAEPL